ncbi:aromatic/alkene monooxygenase hydroxylase subunit beta [Paraburkholderia lycopersici]|uniref:Phenol hydroxylase P1 protein n=1 Tax=Paraburkholderia lycopersici TaxID=416944 RepID=A0A1G6PKA0_9BURK|nr:aromatic/alkene monooxygenase hydroxylase subunit beta [Paraburkholderia lycopersici]SDC80672.1 Phenol hydroxylase P1 protein [Paraburkholderia lycopersici]
MTIDLKTVDIKPLRHTYAHVAQHIGADKTASRYQEGTFGAQPQANFHYRPTWDPDHELFDPTRTAIVMSSWYALKDPRQFYYASWTTTRARQQDTMEANFEFVESRGMTDLMPETLADQALAVLVPLRHAAWGANMNNSQICALGYGTAFTAPAMFHAMDNLGIAQYLTRLALTMAGPHVLDAAKTAWLEDPTWQALRRYVEDTLVLADPVELFVAQNLVLDGLLYPLVYDRFVDEQVALKGGSAVAMLTAFMPEWHDESGRWIDAVVKTMAAESEDNRACLARWAHHWEEQAAAALLPVAELAFPALGHAALDEVREQLRARFAKLGIAQQ